MCWPSKSVKLHAGGRNGGEVAVGEEEQVARVIENRRHVAGDKVFVLAQSDDRRRPIARGHNLVGLVGRDDRNGEHAGQQLHGLADGFFQRDLVSVAALQVLLDQVGDDLGVGLGGEPVAFLDELLLQADVVLHDAVVDDDDLSGAVTMRMRVLLGRTSVRGPAGVADAVGAIERLQPDDLFQIAQLALSAAHLQAVSVAADGDAGGVIAAIFEAAQAINDDRYNSLVPDVSNNPAHRLVNLY